VVRGDFWVNTPRHQVSDQFFLGDLSDVDRLRLTNELDAGLVGLLRKSIADDPPHERTGGLVCDDDLHGFDWAIHHVAKCQPPPGTRSTLTSQTVMVPRPFAMATDVRINLDVLTSLTWASIVSPAKRSGQARHGPAKDSCRKEPFRNQQPRPQRVAVCPIGKGNPETPLFSIVRHSSGRAPRALSRAERRLSGGKGQRRQAAQLLSP
jgi:hypothetical protein